MADLQPTDQPRRPWNIKLNIGWGFAFVLGIIVISNIGFVLSHLRPLFQQNIRGPESHRGVGQKLTFLELDPLTGGPPSLSVADLQGHVTLLNIWGTWCPPCREELPHMANLQKRFADRETFRLLAISYPPGGRSDDRQSLREDTEELLKRLNLDLPTYCDPGSKTLSAVDQLIVFSGYPTSVLLDRHGVVRDVWVGYRPGVETEMERRVDEVLSEKP
jgi:thiol-disulfide isomerase/thioredoxin